jgi:hypothetical protein
MACASVSVEDADLYVELCDFCEKNIYLGA